MNTEAHRTSNPMLYGSVCSGIEAATVAWHPLGWRAAFYSEIDAFPSALLAHYYPETPNLGDMTRFTEWPDAAIDVLVGGTPCQSFSVAGLRKGLADPRGGLALTFLEIARRYRPRWILWENVPGVLSQDGGDAIRSFLDGLEELGYVVDVDILDAQFHGVPQRRRRVFVCAQSVETLIAQTTDSSALTIAQCWLEILHGILASRCTELESAPDDSGLAYLTEGGVKRRMRLFGLHGDCDNYEALRQNLDAAFMRLQNELGSSGAGPGENGKVPIPEDRSTDSGTEGPFTLTAASLSASLEESYEVMKSYITSTSTSSITPSEIFTCSRAALLIARLILRLNRSSPSWWSAASSALIALEAFTSYARFTSSDLFGDVGRVQAWRDFIEQAERVIDSIGCSGIESFGEIFPVSASLSGHPAPSREARESPPHELAPSIGASGRGFSRTGETRGKDPVIAMARNAHSSKYDAESETLIVHALRTDGFDASEDGTGRGTPLTLAIRGRDGESTLECHDDGLANAILTPTGGRGGIGVGAVAFHARQDPDSGPVTHPLDTDGTSIAVAIQAGALRENPASGPDGVGAQEGIAYTLEARAEVQAVQNRTHVRRLTPRECARLQGFPDDYLELTYANAEEAHAAQVLHELWRQAGAQRTQKQERRAGIAAALLTPEVLLAGVHAGWLSWSMAAECVASGGALSSADARAQGLLRSLREASAAGCSPYRRKSFEQCVEQLGGSLPELSYEIASARAALRHSRLWQDAQRAWPLRYAFATEAQRRSGKSLNPDGPRYKALGNSMAVPVMRWLGERIELVESVAQEIAA